MPRRWLPCGVCGRVGTAEVSYDAWQRNGPGAGGPGGTVECAPIRVPLACCLPVPGRGQAINQVCPSQSGGSTKRLLGLWFRGGIFCWPASPSMVAFPCRGPSCQTRRCANRYSKPRARRLLIDRADTLGQTGGDVPPRPSTGKMPVPHGRPFRAGGRRSCLRQRQRFTPLDRARRAPYVQADRLGHEAD